jgi:hypothetical protein
MTERLWQRRFCDRQVAKLRYPAAPRLFQLFGVIDA